MSADFTLPLSQPESRSQTAREAWGLGPVHPSTLIALWPHKEMPSKIEIIAALQQHCGRKLEEIETLDNPSEVFWNGVFKLPGLDSPVIIWVEKARPLSPDDINDPEILACEWMIGFEAQLSPAQPYDDFVLLLRAAAAISDSPAILDPATHRWSEKQLLADITADPPADPPLEILWTIQAVSPDGADSDVPSAIWLHTHGLWRCGWPELEMLEVPREAMRPAARLLNAIAEHMLDSDPPMPGEILTIGPGLDVTLHPWQNIAPDVDARNPGGMDDRSGEENPHAGVRAVVCGPKPKGAFRKLWVWPSDAVHRLANEDVVIFQTQKRTERRAHMAQERWSEFATAFAGARQAKNGSSALQPVFLVKSGRSDTDGGDREHLWFEVKSLRGEEAQAELVNEPMRLQTLRKGDAIKIGRETISDWMVITPAGNFGPTDVPAMWRAIRS